MTLDIKVTFIPKRVVEDADPYEFAIDHGNASFWSSCEAFLEKRLFYFLLFLLILLFRTLIVNYLHMLGGNKSNVILLSPVNAALKND